MPIKHDDGSETHYFLEWQLDLFEKRTEELEDVEAFMQVCAEIDSWIDYGMLELLYFQFSSEETRELIGDLFHKFNILDGTKMKTILHSTGVIGKELYDKIGDFKRKRNKVIHNKHHIFALVKESTEFTEKERNERTDNAIRKYLQMKKTGKEIMKELLDLWIKENS